MISIAAKTLPTPSMKSLAAHVIVTLAHAQADGRAVRLDELASEIGVRKADVRDAVTRLHAEGHVDALRLRLTMSGLALGSVLASCTLKEPRRRAEPRREQAIARVA